MSALPFASSSWSTGCWTKATPLCAVLDGAVVSASFVAAPAVPSAVNVTGLPVSPLDVAVRVFVPAVVLRVQLPTVAIPLPFVVWVPAVTLPLPAAGANVTVTPCTGLRSASHTTELQSLLTVLSPSPLLFPSPTLFRSPSAVNVTGLPVSPLDVAVRVFVPAVVLRVQLPTVAIPLPFVVWVPPLTLPLPAAGANVTVTPCTGLPLPSCTITDGGEATALPAGADCVVRLLAPITAAVPALRS